MTKIYEMMPDLQGEEMAFLQSLTNDYNEEKLRNFSRRKDPQLILLLTLLGFIGFAGVHRFILNQIGMAILCFYTAGLCLIATILDLLNYKCPAFNSNGHVATEINTRLSKLTFLAGLC